LVKEELAIVEFLTAKATASTKSKSGSSRPSDQQGDQTPVDLLLNLAKTRSGRRAAEEEKRQLRLQQYREVEEQRRASSKQGQGQGQGSRDGNSMASPWGYQAPQMPGLDVQQPFGSNGTRKVPRPLAAPSTKRDDRNTNEAMNDPWNLGFNLNGSGGLSQPQFNMSRPSSSNAGNGNLDNSNTFPQLQSDMGQLSFPSASSSNSFEHNMALANLHQQQQQQQQLQQQQQQQQTNLSPESMFNVNTGGSDPNSAQSQNQPQTQSQMDSMQLFGNAMMDQFDFSDLGLGSGVQNNTVETSFNPFALAQAEDA
jgi:hypothetical protein